MNWSPDGLVTLMGIVLSLVCAYFPMVKDWFDQLDPKLKPLTMALILLLVTAGKLLVECRLDTSCLLFNWQTALWAWLVALIANQSTFAVAVKQFKKPTGKAYTVTETGQIYTR